MPLHETKSSLLQNEAEDVKHQLKTAVWQANPQSPVDDAVSQSQIGNTIVLTMRKRKASGMSTFFVTSIVIGLFMIIFSRASLQSVDEELSLLLFNREQSREKVQGFEKYTHLIHRKLSVLDTMIQQKEDPENLVPENNEIPSLNGQNTDEIDELMTMQKSVNSLRASAEHLKSQVQTFDMKDVDQKHGSGVHLVEIKLAFPDGEGPNTFVLQLAPMDLMPHSVHFFLDVVSAGLLDGYSFIMNAGNVLVAAPLPYDGSSAAEKARAFTRQGLVSLAFKEYSEHFPHKIYTVGFAVDGSPSFYINTKDNENVHAGDPCFGIIVSGFNVLQRLEKIQVINSIWLKQRVGVESATILSVHQNRQ